MERLYKSMKHVGGANITFGVIIIVVGVSVGVLSIINGAKLLKAKAEIMF